MPNGHAPYEQYPFQKRRIIDSDDDDEPVKPKSASKDKKKPNLDKLKAKPTGKQADLANAFGKSPVKRVEKDVRKKAPIAIDIPSDDEFEKSIINLDENKLAVKSPRKSPHKKESLPSKSPKSSKRERSPEKKKTPPESSKKKSGSPHSPSKKIKSEPKTNGQANSPAKTSPTESPATKKTPSTSDKSASKKKSFDSPQLTDEERHERKIMSAILFQKFKNRAGCPNPGSKVIPNGRPNCLAGKVFIVSGILDSMERNEADDLIKKYGGKIVSGVTKKLNYMVIGEEPGPAKLAKAQEYGVTMLTEDDLLDMIRGGPAIKSEVKEEVSSAKVKEERSSAKVKKEPTPKKEEPKKESPRKKRIKDEPEEESFQTFTVKKKLKIEKEEPKPGSSKAAVNISPDKPAVPTCDEKNLAWVDKYKPTAIKQIIGQQGPASNTNK